MLPTASATTEGPGAGQDAELKLVVNDRAEAFIFHNRDFRKQVSWIEYDLDTHMLDVIMNDGDIRGLGFAVDPQWNKYLQNAYQIMLVRMDEKTGKPLEGFYYPLILHKA